MRLSVLAAICALAVPSQLLAQSEAPAKRSHTYAYFADEIFGQDQTVLPTPVATRRRSDGILDGCRETNARISASLIPIAMFFVNSIFGRIDEGLSRREDAQIKRLSTSFSTVRTDAQFFLGDRVARCFVVDRVEQRDEDTGDGAEVSVFRDQSTYVLVFEKVGETGFHLREVRSKVSDTAAWATLDEDDTRAANVNLGIGIRSVALKDGHTELVQLPEFTFSISGLRAGQIRASESSTIGTTVMPIPQGEGIPTSIAISITESDVSLASRRQQAALAQKMRAALFAALGKSIEKEISD